jgi:D-aminopeptidase
LEKHRQFSQTAFLEKDQGSIMVVIATDLPVSSRQLFRIIRRAGVGIARTGSYTGHGSGEIMIGFSTANRIYADGPALRTVSVLAEDFLDAAFAACAEAVCEAVLNSMTAAGAVLGRHGEMYHSLSEFMGSMEEN